MVSSSFSFLLGCRPLLPRWQRCSCSIRGVSAMSWTTIASCTPRGSMASLESSCTERPVSRMCCSRGYPCSHGRHCSNSSGGRSMIGRYSYKSLTSQGHVACRAQSCDRGWDNLFSLSTLQGCRGRGEYLGLPLDLCYSFNLYWGQDPMIKPCQLQSLLSWPH